jgi:hypothetical protein
VTPFATVDQLADYLQLKIADGDESAAALQSLSLASAAVRSMARNPIDQTIETDLILDGDGSGTIVLPQFPVLSIAKVETLSADGLTWTLLAYPNDYRWNSAGILQRISAADPDVRFSPFVWPDRMGSVRVTYTHGYAVIPEELVSIVLSAAARAFTNPTGLVLESVSGYSARYAPNTHGIEFTPNELAVLGRFRDVAVA